MAEPRHKMQSQSNCDIQGCGEAAERSLSVKKVEAAGMNASGASGSSAHLCKKHYREFKKKSKKDRELERVGW
jgi:hypothetical protein